MSVRAPLMDRRGARMQRELQEHADAPRWTYAAGDRLTRADLGEVERFREELARPRAACGARPAPAILARLVSESRRVPWMRERVEPGRAWEDWPTSCRAELGARPADFIPDGEDLGPLVIYRTAGTTGHPISTPHHPRAIGCYAPLLESAAARHGVTLDPGPGRVGCFLLSSQIRTYTYATALSAWRGAGFAKLNLRPTEWPTPGSSRRYLDAFAPPLLTGDPVAFDELARLGTALRPRALVSTSIALSPARRADFARTFGCPVIDWYSLVETGPIASTCPEGHFHVLPHDIHVDILDRKGRPAARGEIAVSGGRNPYLPLLRYRTGDTARLDRSPCPCGDTAPRLLDFEGRAPVTFRAADDTPVTTVDVARVLREFPLLLHAFRQHPDRSCTLTARPAPGARPKIAALRAALQNILGPLPVQVRLDPRLEKVVAWKSDL